MSIDFGDAEPEDAWHPDDLVAELIDNLCQRCTLLGEPRRLRDGATPAQLLVELVERLARFRDRAGRYHVSDRDRHRADLIGEDIDHVRRRLARG